MENKEVEETLQPEGTDPSESTKQTEEAKETGFRAFIKSLFEGKEEEPTDPAASNQDDSKKDEDKKSETNATEPATATLAKEEVEKMLEEEKQKWEAEKAEQERLKKLSPEERKQEEEKNLQKENEVLKQQLKEKELKDQAITSLSAEGYPVKLADLLQYDSKDNMEKSLTTATSILKECVEMAVKERLRGSTPKGLGVNKKTENDLTDQIAKAIKG